MNSSRDSVGIITDALPWVNVRQIQEVSMAMSEGNSGLMLHDVGAVVHAT